MSFHATAAHSSRIKRARKLSTAASLGLPSTASSPSSAASRPRSTPKVKTPAHDADDEKLHDLGLIAPLAQDLNFHHVPQYMEYIRTKMFADIPAIAAGMSSMRIAEVLNYRRALPPIVTVAHIDALGASSTATEREITDLSRAGILRRVTIPRRGLGASDVGDGLASVQLWQQLVHAHAELDDALKQKYISVMDANPTSATIPNTAFTPAEASILTTTGFLTTSTASDSHSSSFSSPGSVSMGCLSSLSSAGSRYAAGSLGAVGGSSASLHIPGRETASRTTASAYYNFSLPNTGSHIKLLVDARSHMLSLLDSSRYKEALLAFMRQRWDGGIIGKDVITERKRSRKEFSGVLPGRTKKWKQFRGLRFDWILEECLGAGLVEIFETGSVGPAVRTI
ncbi:hypothetical protein BS50DRAFT_527629 [Corynespora cassiicola Philippines]|uniref:Serine-threonine protein kinase 19 n=1 Tax=Corynespora cassiicola Philippines TaxID=1448308 RepID=A0A2T2NIR9_CORCC|nr:hypothetical protein BS50DRAFT_527629 [Corynespora cassiicola Philippines]